jgi:Holliday junction resolvase RusA-like endonuclease
MTEYVERIEFWVEGVPIPQGSKSVFRGRAVDANPKLKPWRRTVTDAAVEALAGRDGFDPELALFVLLDFYLPRGKTVTRPRPNVKPDGDNLLRAICDSITDAGVWADDSRAVVHHSEKWYADDKPGVRVVIGALA